MHAVKSVDENSGYGFEQCSSVAELHGCMRQYATDLGFEHFIYATMLVNNPAQPMRFAVSGYPRSWRTRYDEMGYLKTDPIIRHCLSSPRPIFWDEVERKDAMSKLFFEDAASHGLVNGMTCPIIGRMREMGAMSLATARKLTLTPAQRSEMQHSLHWNAMLVCEAFERVALTPISEGAGNPLSDREQEVLGMVAGGLTDRSISNRLNISESTVRFHITRAGEKLGGVSGRHQIVAHAQAMGRLEMDHRSLASDWFRPETREYPS